MQPELQTGNTGFGGVAIAPEAQKVLRNTYMLLALTMVPTIAGAWIGMATTSIITGSPILSFFLMLGRELHPHPHCDPVPPTRRPGSHELRAFGD